MHVVQFSLEMHKTQGDTQSMQRLMPREESMYWVFVLHVLQFYALSWHDLHDEWQGKHTSRLDVENFSEI